MPMHNRDTVAAFIDRIVAGARIPSRAGREDMRRELWTHFEEEDGTSPEAVRSALRRFGPEAMVIESFRRVHRRDYALLYLAKIVASILASIAAALLIEILVNLRLEVQADTWRLAPGFGHAAQLSAGVALGLVGAREFGRRPFNRLRAAAAIGGYLAVCGLVRVMIANSVGALVLPTVLVALGYLCSKVEPRPARVLLTFGAFAAALYATHLLLSVAFGPGRALLASAVLVAVWASTVVILARVDHAFLNFFEPAASP
jgi:hypothetical protein